MPHIETALKKRHLIIPTQQEGVKALAPVFPEEKGIRHFLKTMFRGEKSVRRSLKIMFREAEQVLKDPEKLEKPVGPTIGDIQLSAMSIPDRRGYYVTLDSVQDTGEDLIILPHDTLLQQIAEHTPGLEQAVVTGSAVMAAPTEEDAAQIVKSVLATFPFVQEIPLIEGHANPDMASMRPMHYYLRYFPITQARNPADYAQDLFSATTYSFPPDNEYPQGQELPETVKGMYQTTDGLNVSLFAQEPTQEGVKIYLSLAKFRNPFLGRVQPMVPQEATFVEQGLQQLKQELEQIPQNA